MQIILPTLPQIKDGKMDDVELRKFLQSLQIVIKQIAEKIDA